MTFYPYCGAARPAAFLRYQQASDPAGRIDACLSAVHDLSESRCLDLGAGNAFYARRLARSCRHVIAVEPDPMMRAQAARLLAEPGAPDNVVVLAGDAEDIPLPDASVDIVHARFAYFFGDDACLPGIAEVRRVLRSGGSFFVIDSSADGTLGALYRRYFPKVFADQSAVLAFWAKHGFGHRLVETTWEARDRTAMAAAFALEHPPEQVREILAEVSGTTLTYAVHVFHWRKPDRVEPPIPGEVLERIGASLAEPTGPPQRSGNGEVLALDVRHGDTLRRCVRKTVAVGLREIDRWHALGAAGAPLPDLVAAWTDDLGRDVLLLERLPLVGIDGTDQAAFMGLIDTLAHFAACRAPGLVAGPDDRIVAWTGALRLLWERCRNGGFGDAATAAAASLDGGWDAIFDLARWLDAQLARLPRVPTHHDPAYPNCGRRTVSGPILLFDLGYADHAPVGRDLALAIGGFVQARPTAVTRAGCLARWSQAYRAAGGPAIDDADLAAAVDGWLVAQPLWMDRRTLSQASAAWRRDTAAFAKRWGSWFANTWATIGRMLTD